MQDFKEVALIASTPVQADKCRMSNPLLAEVVVKYEPFSYITFRYITHSCSLRLYSTFIILHIQLYKQKSLWHILEWIII